MWYTIKNELYNLKLNECCTNVKKFLDDLKGYNCRQNSEKNDLVDICNREVFTNYFEIRESIK